MLNHIKALSGVGERCAWASQKDQRAKHKTMLTHKLRSGVGVLYANKYITADK